MDGLFTKAADLFYYVTNRDKYIRRVGDRKTAPFRARYYEAVESSLRGLMGDDSYVLYLHAQASDLDFLKITHLVYETGWLNHVLPEKLAPLLVHGIYVYTCESKVKGKLATLGIIDFVKEESAKNQECTG